jgi:hypothetical protein
LFADLDEVINCDLADSYGHSREFQPKPSEVESLLVVYGLVMG